MRRARDSVTDNFLAVARKFPPSYAGGGEIRRLLRQVTFDLADSITKVLSNLTRKQCRLLSLLRPRKSHPKLWIFCGRRRRDSNSRWPFDHATFPRWWNKPLSDSSVFIRILVLLTILALRMLGLYVKCGLSAREFGGRSGIHKSIDKTAFGEYNHCIITYETIHRNLGIVIASPR